MKESASWADRNLSIFFSFSFSCTEHRQDLFYCYAFPNAFSWKVHGPVQIKNNTFGVVFYVFYYFHFKYGHFETLTEPDSLMVFGIITLISFVIGYIGMIFSSHKIMEEIHSYIEILEESANYNKIIAKDKKQRLKRIILMLLFLIAGLVLFLLIL